MSDEQHAPEEADAVALLLAHLRGDEQGVYAMINMVGCERLFAVTVGFLVDQVVGRDELAAWLARWQRRRLS